MNVFKVIGRVFKALGKGTVAFFKVAQERGLADDITEKALDLVSTAQAKFNDNYQRLEFAVAMLVAAKVPE